MARYTGPKHKLARREGINILEKMSRSLDRRLNIVPGIHGKKGRRKFSEYGIQLREKQKLKRIYGVLEQQFQRYVHEAEKSKNTTTDALIQTLETRLDNIVYRLGFANSRNQARQFVSHRHVLVNGRKVNIPSYTVKVGDVVTLSPNLASLENLKTLIESERELAPFLLRQKGAGKLTRMPEREEVPNPVDYQLVIEFYSR